MVNLFSTVRIRIILVLMITMAITLTVGVFGVRGISALSSSMHDTYTGNVVPIAQVGDVRSQMFKIRLVLWKMQAQKNKAIGKDVRDLQKQMDASWKAYYA